MKITIFAATGGIGGHLLDQGLAAGHEVTAAVRDPSKLPAGVRAVQVDLARTEPAAIESAIAGADAVLSGLGPRSRADAGITGPGTRAIVEAMKATGVRRIVVVSAAPTGTVAPPGRAPAPRYDPGDGFFMRHLFSPMIVRILREHYVDLAVMEELLRDSGLDWTVIRPPKLSDKPLTGVYQTAYERNIRGGWSIPRADVAHLMLAVLDQPESIGHIIGAAS
jgi:putative NADH-flavin reductase